MSNPQAEAPVVLQAAPDVVEAPAAAIVESSPAVITPEPVRMAEVAAPQPVEVVAAPAPAPVPVAVPAPQPVAVAPVATAPVFVAVDQIGESEPAVPREPRRRARNTDGGAASEPLVFIETAAEKLQNVVMPVEEEAPRRRAPRARKPRDMATEPLVFVETKPGDQPEQSAQ